MSAGMFWNMSERTLENQKHYAKKKAKSIQKFQDLGCTF